MVHLDSMSLTSLSSQNSPGGKRKFSQMFPTDLHLGLPSLSSLLLCHITLAKSVITMHFNNNVAVGSFIAIAKVIFKLVSFIRVTPAAF